MIGHGTGKSNAGQHLTEYLRTKHRETYQRIVREKGVLEKIKDGTYGSQTWVAFPYLETGSKSFLKRYSGLMRGRGAGPSVRGSQRGRQRGRSGTARYLMH